MPVITKNQIRPRRIKVHFTNAEILLLDTVGFFSIVGPAPLGQALAISLFEIRTNIVQVYGNIDAAANAFLFDDYGFVTIENDVGITSLISDLFSTTGVNLVQGPSISQTVDSSGNTVANFNDNWTDLPDLHANGGIGLTWNNGGADFNGGDPANFLDIFFEYRIVNLT